MNAELATHLGLQAEPFPHEPCTDYYFQTAPLTDIQEELFQAVSSRQGMLLLLGAAGLGKTSLLCQLVPRLRESGVRTAWIATPLAQKVELLAAVARDFGVRVPQSPHLAELLETLHTHFLEVKKQGGNCAIVIDEAHLLELQAFEVLRMLSNLEVGGQKLVQILLAGQAELQQKLEQPELRQLRSRINLVHQLRPLSAKETGEYVNFRLSMAGSDLQLEGRGLSIVRDVSGGNFRRINMLMEKVLSVLVSRGEQQLNSAIVLEGLREVSAWDPDLGGKLRRMQLRRFAALLAGAMAVGLAVGLVLMFWQPWSPAPVTVPDVAEQEVFEPEERLGPAAKPQQEPAEQNTSETSSEVSSEKLMDSPPLVAETQDTQSAPASEQASSLPEDEPTGAQEPVVQEEAAAQEPLPAVQNDLSQDTQRFLEPWGLEDQLRNALYEAVRHNKTGDFAKAVAAAGNPEQLPLQIVTLERKPPERKYKLTSFPWRHYSDFGPAWLVLWRPPVSMRHYAMEQSSPDIVALQERLDLLGYYRMGIDGKVGPGTWKAVQLFQRDHDLEPTGIPDADTLFWLYHTNKKAKPGTAVVRTDDGGQAQE